MIEPGLAIARLLVLEGGWVDNPADAGGETYKGISRRNWPTWRGWALIDRWKADRLNFPANLETDPELQRLVVQFYREEFWRAEYELLPTQDLANKVFDLGVNMGARVAVKLLQRSCRASIAGADLRDDGSWGPQTTAAVQQANATCLLVALRSEAAGYYRSIVASKQSQTTFIEGWLARAYA